MTELGFNIVPAVKCEACGWGPCHYMQGWGGILNSNCIVVKEETTRQVRASTQREPREVFSFD